MRSRTVGGGILLGVTAMMVLALGAGADSKQGNREASGGYDVRGISFEVEHQPDGKRYPVYLKEYYGLGKTGKLEYTAYFGGMPIEMNHMDSVKWDGGALGAKVFEAVRRVLDDPALQAGLEELRDGVPTPAIGEGLYLVWLTKDHADSTRSLKDKKSPAFAPIHAAFSALIAGFEKATGRPLKPADLPQAPRREDVRPEP